MSYLSGDGILSKSEPDRLVQDHHVLGQVEAVLAGIHKHGVHSAKALITVDVVIIVVITVGDVCVCVCVCVCVYLPASGTK